MKTIKKNKKLLIYAHYFYPDVASTGQLLTELSEELSEEFDITIICTVPSYTGKIPNQYKNKNYYFEKKGKIKLIRVKVPEFSKDQKISRIKNIVTYFFRSIIATFKVGKQDVVYSISQPPILGGLLGIIGKLLKKAKYIYNIQDFNPEQSQAVGYMNNKLMYKLALILDKLSCKMSDMVVIVGRDMENTLKSRFNNKNLPNFAIINNWANERQLYPIETDNDKVLEFKKKYDLENKFVIQYSGNLGLYYDLDNILKVIKNFKDVKDVVFLFIGEGTLKNKLVSYKEDNSLENVKFVPYQEKENLIYSLNAGDIHWVVNAKGIKGVSVPSKLYGIMAVGKPVLGVLEQGSEASLIIQESNCGLIAEPGNYSEIKNLIDKVIKNKENIIKSGINGRTYLEHNLTREVSVEKYSSIIKYL